MEEQIGIFKIIQESFIKAMQEYSVEFSKEKEIISGNSTAFGEFVTDFRSKFAPVFEELLQEFIRLQEQKDASEMENSNCHALIQLFTQDHDFLYQWNSTFQKDYLRLWQYVRESVRLTVEFAGVSGKIYKEYQKTLVELEKTRLEKAELDDKIASLEAECEYQTKYLEEILENDQLLINAQKAFNGINESGATKLQEIEEENRQKIEQILSEKDKMKLDFEERAAQNEAEITEIKAKNEEIQQEKEKLSEEKEKLENSLKEKCDELEQMSKIVTRNTKLETAISEFCQRFNFITFDGETFDCKPDDFKGEDIVKFSTDIKDKQIQQLTKEKMELQRRIIDLRTSKSEQKEAFDKQERDHQDEKEAILTKMKELNSTINKMKLDAIVLQTRLNDSEVERKKSEKVVNELSQQITTLKNGARQQEDKSGKEKLNQKNALKEQINSLMIQRPRQQINLAQQAMNLADQTLKDSNNKLRKEKIELEKLVESLRARLPIEEGGAQNAETNQEIERLRQELDRKRFECKELKKKNRDLQEKNEKLMNNDKEEEHPPPEVPILGATESRAPTEEKQEEAEENVELPPPETPAPSPAAATEEKAQEKAETTAEENTEKSPTHEQQ